MIANIHIFLLKGFIGGQGTHLGDRDKTLARGLNHFNAFMQLLT